MCWPGLKSEIRAKQSASLYRGKYFLENIVIFFYSNWDKKKQFEFY